MSAIRCCGRLPTKSSDERICSVFNSHVLLQLQLTWILLLTSQVCQMQSLLIFQYYWTFRQLQSMLCKVYRVCSILHQSYSKTLFCKKPCFHSSFLEHQLSFVTDTCHVCCVKHWFSLMQCNSVVLKSLISIHSMLTTLPGRHVSCVKDWSDCVATI